MNGSESIGSTVIGYTCFRCGVWVNGFHLCLAPHSQQTWTYSPFASLSETDVQRIADAVVAKLLAARSKDAK